MENVGYHGSQKSHKVSYLSHNWNNLCSFGAVAISYKMMSDGTCPDSFPLSFIGGAELSFTPLSWEKVEDSYFGHFSRVLLQFSQNLQNLSNIE